MGDKGESQCKLACKLFKEQYGYDPLLDKYMFSVLFQLKNFLGGFQQFVTVVGKCIFDSNVDFLFFFLLEIWINVS